MSELERANVNEEETPLDIWGDDKLGRKADADYLIHFLTRRVEERGELGQDKSYVLNIDAGWGGGKSFFLDRLGDQLEEESYLVARVNAWEDDHTEDPLIAVMAAIGETVEKQFDETSSLAAKWRNLTSKVGGIAFTVGSKFILYRAGKYFGEDTIEAGLQSAKESRGPVENAVSVFQKEKETVLSFKKDLNLLLTNLKTGKHPLFILVDEMDRCRPPYAIALLERVKHLFNIDNVVFVFATDTHQLSHSIKAVYGEGFDGRSYLHRFFDQTYKFSNIPKLAFVKELCRRNGLDNESLELPDATSEVGGLAEFLTDGFEEFDFELRDILQCMDHLRNVITGWPYERHKMHAILLLPLIVGFHKGVPLLWNGNFPYEIERLAYIAGYSEKNGQPQRTLWKFLYSSQKSAGFEDVSWFEIFNAYISHILRDEAGLAMRRNQQPPDWEREILENIERDYELSSRRFGKRRRKVLPEDLTFWKYIDAVVSAGRMSK